MTSLTMFNNQAESFALLELLYTFLVRASVNQLEIHTAFSSLFDIGAGTSVQNTVRLPAAR